MPPLRRPAAGEQTRGGSTRGPVSYRAPHISGSLDTTSLTPLQAMWAGAPAMAIADGVDEVHKVTVAPTY